MKETKDALKENKRSLFPTFEQNEVLDKLDAQWIKLHA